MNLQKPDDRTLAALKRLRGDQDFLEVLAWLEACLVDIDRKNRVITDPPLLYQGQGAAQAISTITQYGQNGKVLAIAAKAEMRTG